MQQDADFITADFLYIFWASSAHHQEYKILTRQGFISSKIGQYRANLISRFEFVSSGSYKFLPRIHLQFLIAYIHDDTSLLSLCMLLHKR